MDIKSFLRLVYKYKWLLILVPVIAASVTYFLTRNLPKQYSSEVSISTGLLDPSKKLISNETTDFFKVSQQFSNMIEKLKAKKTIDLLSYQLMLHDLQQPEKSFRNYSQELSTLSSDQKAELIALIKDKLLKKSILTLSDNNGIYPLYDLVESMGYNEENLSDKMEVKHVENSDYINIEYVSENPDLSAYVVNTLASVFITNFSANLSTNQNASIMLLDSLLKRKELIMNEKNSALSTFKRTKGVLNLDEQSATVYSQISEYEAQRAQALRLIQSNQGAIAIIQNKLRGGDPYIGGSSRNDNQEIIKLKRQLELANASYIDNNFNARDQRKIDSLSRILSEKSAVNIEENILDPRSSKQSLVQQKLSLEIALQQAKSSIKTLDNQLTTLRSRYSSMVPFDAEIQNYEREAELATKDYMAALDLYNSNRNNQKMGLQLEIDQIGLVGNPEPSREILYTAGAGFTTLILCLGSLFLASILDGAIYTQSQLAIATKSKPLGQINFIEGPEKSVRSIWSDKSGNKNYETFKDLLRSLRFEIEDKMSYENSKILGITSLVDGEGKTFISHSLAYAFAMTGKKILLISDDQLIKKSDTKEIASSQNFQKFLIKKEIHVEDLITFMNKSTEKDSLFEIQNIHNLRAGFAVLRKEFDLIIIDINSMSDMNITKEWLLFTENSICIYEAGRTMNDNDKQFLDSTRTQPGFIGWVLNKYISQKFA